MGSVPVAAPRVDCQSRPGRGVLVAAGLPDLHGPVHGVVELPIHLFWHPDRHFDLDQPGILPWVYQTVLREATRAEDLAVLDGDTLIRVWPELFLPRGVRQAWEDAHPELRAAVPAPA